MSNKCLPDSRVTQYKKRSRHLQRQCVKVNKVVMQHYAKLAELYTPYKEALSKRHYRTANRIARNRHYHSRKGDIAVRQLIELSNEVYVLGIKIVHIRQGIIPPLDAPTLPLQPL